MELATLCQRALVTVDASCTLREVAREMLAQHVGAIVVTRSTDGLQDVVGVVTDRDLAMACVARSLDPGAVLVGAIASNPPVCIAATHSAAQAAGVRRLLVREPDGRVLGLLSSDDLLEALVAPLRTLAQGFHSGIERERGRGDDALYATGATPYLRLQPRAMPG